jgi:HEAT repeat protein
VLKELQEAYRKWDAELIPPRWKEKAGMKKTGKADGAARDDRGPEVQEAVPALIAALKDEGRRRDAADALGAIGPGAKAAVPALLAVLKDRDAYTRSRVAYALGSIGPEAKVSVPALIEVSKQEAECVRLEACTALIRLGKADAGIPPLLKLLKEDSKRRTDSFLNRIGGALLANDIFYRRKYLGPESTEAVPVLVRALKDENEGVRSFAWLALMRIGPGAKEAVPALAGMLKDKEHTTRSRAALALGHIGPQAKEAFPALIQSLRGCWDLEYCETAAEALKKIDPKAAAKAGVR